MHFIQPAQKRNFILKCKQFFEKIAWKTNEKKAFFEPFTKELSSFAQTQFYEPFWIRIIVRFEVCFLFSFQRINSFVVRALFCEYCPSSNFEFLFRQKPNLMFGSNLPRASVLRFFILALLLLFAYDCGRLFSSLLLLFLSWTYILGLRLMMVDDDSSLSSMTIKMVMVDGWWIEWKYK